MRLLPPIAVLVCALGLPACVTTGTSHLPGTQSGVAANEPAPAARTAIRDVLLKDAAPGANTDPVTVFYQAREFSPAWTGDGQESAQAARVLLARAGEQGLRAEDYDVESDCGDGVKCDIALTAAVLRYAHDVRAGRVAPGSVYDDIELPAAGIDAAAELNQAVASHTVSDWLAGLPPSHPQYRRLVQALAKYRGIVDQGGWPTLPGKEINPDGKDRGAKLLVKRLAFEDPVLAGIAKPSPAQIREAVKRFQTRNGLGKDGRVEGKTLAALNLPASFRAAQIAANMERWRWMPSQFEDRAIAVNVPDQSLAFLKDGQAVLNSPVVVGQKASPTPIFAPP